MCPFSFINFSFFLKKTKKNPIKFIQVALAQSDYEKELLQLENFKLSKKLATTKLKLMEEQQRLTKLEASRYQKKK